METEGWHTEYDSLEAGQTEETSEIKIIPKTKAEDDATAAGIERTALGNVIDRVTAEDDATAAGIERTALGNVIDRVTADASSVTGERSPDESNPSLVNVTSTKEMTHGKDIPEVKLQINTDDCSDKPIRFVLGLANSEILKGKDVTLKCQLSRSEPVTWTKDGSPLAKSAKTVLQTEDTSHQLHIPKVRMEDAGTYAVHIGEISSSCTVTVKELPEVYVCKGDLWEIRVNAVVTTIGPDLSLVRGAISKSILTRAGQSLQNEILNKYPNGLSDIGETGPHGLQNCQRIFFIPLEEYKGPLSIKALEKHVLNCLLQADSSKFTSIAFPTIGAGNLLYPKPMVAEAMFGALKTALENWGGFYSLNRVKFVIYDSDHASWKEFRSQESKWKSFLRCRNCDLRFQNLVLRIDVGSLQYPRKDCLVYLWAKKIIYNVTFGENSFLHSGESHVQAEFNSHRGSSERMDILITEGGNIPVKHIMHVPCEDSIGDIKAKIQTALTASNKLQCESVCIGFDKKHVLLRHESELVEAVIDAVEKFSNSTHSLSEITILFENDTVPFKEVLERHQKMQRASKSQAATLSSTVTVRVSGLEDDVKQEIVRDIVEVEERKTTTTEELKFELKNTVIPINPEIERSEVPSIRSVLEKGNGSQNQERDSIFYPWKAIEGYIVVKKIANHHTHKSLRRELADDLSIGDLEWKLVFCDNDNEAVIIFKDSNEADKLLQMKTKTRFLLSTCDKMACERYQQTVDGTSLRLLKQKNVFQMFFSKMKANGILIIKDEPLTLEFPTRYQLKFFLQTLKKLTTSFGSSDTTSVGSSGALVSVENVSKIQYDILIKWKSDQKFHFKDKYDENLAMLSIELSNEAEKGDFETMKSFLSELKERELHDLTVQKEHYEIALDFCRTNELKMCFFLQDQLKVIVASKSYDEFLMLKHQYDLKTGKRKSTGRSRARCLIDESSASSCHFAKTERKLQCDSNNQTERRNLQTYTINNLRVYVYEADILKFRVDCIVNAANETLQHGGGVAAVIQRAAGSEPEKECRAYISQHGPLPVGEACVTTAGDLPYKCVVHTVVPRWSDYTPHSIQELNACEQDLYKAINRSFVCAEKEGCRSIALPPVSSAIFGVPQDLCVHQYAKATIDYSQNSKRNASALDEIHFVDENDIIIKKIQQAFSSLIDGTSTYDSKQFVESSTMISNSHRQNDDSAKAEIKLPKPVLEDKAEQLTILLCGKAGKQSLLLSKGDIFKIRATALVVSIDKNGYPGAMGSALVNKMSGVQRKQYSKRVISESKTVHEGDVFITGGYDTNYQYILHAVLPRRYRDSAEHRTLVLTTFNRMFDLLNSMEVDSVTVPTIGLNQISTLDEYCEAFLEGYLSHCKKICQTRDVSAQEVHLVFNQKFIFSEACGFFRRYVIDQQDNLRENDFSDKDKLPYA